MRYENLELLRSLDRQGSYSPALESLLKEEHKRSSLQYHVPYGASYYGGKVDAELSFSLDTNHRFQLLTIGARQLPDLEIRHAEGEAGTLGRELEQAMGRLNWGSDMVNSVYDGRMQPQRHLDQLFQSGLARIRAGLAELSSSNHWQTRLLSRQLQYKYFCYENAGVQSRLEADSLKSEFEIRADFVATVDHIPGPREAFEYMRKELTPLHRELYGKGFCLDPAKGLPFRVKRNRVSLDVSMLREEGFVRYQFDFEPSRSRVGPSYSRYHASPDRHLDLPASVNGVDISRLESRMNALQDSGRKEAETKLAVSFEALKATEEGRLIQQVLIAKCWGQGIGRLVLPQEWLQAASYYLHPAAELPASFGANSAYNLLMGRFVHRRSSTDEWWQYLERGSGDDPFSLSLKDSRGYSRERMEEDLKKVYWIPETELPELSRRLLGGDLCQGTGTYASSLLAANPLAGQVDPYSGSSRRAEPALLVTRVKALQQNQLQRQKPGWTKIYRIRS